MKHQDFHELCALRIYGELDPADSRRLEAHLASCAACAGFALELESGLGRIAGSRASDDLPAGWRQHLAAAGLGSRRPRPLWPRVWPAAASFLAGAALSWSLARAAYGPDPRTHESVRAVGAPAELSGFARADEPPRARDLGTLAWLELARRR